tara:strand:+ start:264 stop:863 length:600 start_codon:yes stop_codon:yes gene_type:complete
MNRKEQTEKFALNALGYVVAIMGVLFLLSMLVSCETDSLEPIPTYELTIDSVLTEDGTQSLSIDSNGFYRLPLDSLDGKQTVRRITGNVLKDDMEPTPPELVEWESSHNWVTSEDDESYVIRRIINALGQWVVVDTIYLNIPSGLIVPTINSSSYSGTDGEINTMIAPIYEMKGDTMTISARMWTRYETYYDTLKVILE